MPLNVPKKQKGEEKKKLQAHQSSCLMTLEPRIMFDAAAMALVNQDASNTQNSTMLDEPFENGEHSHVQEAQSITDIFEHYIPPEKAGHTREIVIIDSRINDYSNLITNLSDNADIHVIGNTNDPIVQISEVLSRYDNLDAIHLVTHGNPGSLSLGSQTFSLHDLENHESQVQSWGKALTPTGDILIYGCDTAKGDQGRLFIDTLSKITDADVAASKDITGHKDLGGDWDLEYQTGKIETQLAVSDHSQEDYYSIFAGTPGAVGTEFLISPAPVSGFAPIPDVAALDDGGFVATWQAFNETGDGDTYGVFARKFDASGSPSGPSFVVNTYTTADQIEPKVTGIAGGGFAITWSSNGQDGSEYGVYTRIFDSAGAPVTSEIQVNTYITGAQQEPDIERLISGNFVVVWNSMTQDGDLEGVYARQFDESGTPLTAEFAVNTTSADSQRCPSIAALNDGGFVITWESFNQDGGLEGIFGQRFSASATPVGSEFQINTTTVDQQIEPSVTSLTDGGFVVVWASMNQDGSDFGCYGQRFDAVAAKVGGEFSINTYITGTQDIPKVTGIQDGGFIVTWASMDQDGSDFGIYGQRFDAAGSKVGTEFIINTTTAAAQDEPSVTTLSNGNFVVVFQSDSGTFGTYAQIFTPDPTTVNDAPVLDISPDPALATIPQDNTDNTGTRVQDLITGLISDADPTDGTGIAVTSIDTANGLWQYSTDGGSTWMNFGVVSDSSATLLSSDTANRIRFIPNPGFSGDAQITYRAWDLSSPEDGFFGVKTDFFSSYDNVEDLVVKPDGRVIAVGSAYDPGTFETRAAISYYTADGVLDNRIGLDGTLTFQVGTNTYSRAMAGLLDGSDTFFVLTSTAADGMALPSFATIAKFILDDSASGAAACYLDTSYGSGGFSIQDSRIGDPIGMAVQPDGKIVVVGTSPLAREWAVIRYNIDGTVDNTFGIAGIVTIDFNPSTIPSEEGCGIAVQADGKIVVTGIAESGDFGLGVARLNPDGSLDTGFNSTGTLFDGRLIEERNNITALQPDGKTLVGGYAKLPGWPDTSFALVRYNADGSVDTGFGTGGMALANMAGDVDVAQTIYLQSDGKILLAGRQYNGSESLISIARFNPDGSLDTSFSLDGIINDSSITDSMEGADAVYVQPDGKIILAGSAAEDFILVRYKADGSIDSHFGVNGKRGVDVSVNGGTSAFSAASETASIHVDGAPSLAAGETALYNESNPPVVIDNTISIFDDSPNLVEARITIGTNYIEGFDRLDFTPTGSITGTWDAPSATLTLTGIDTISNYQNALRSVTFETTSTNPDSGGGFSRSIAFEINDGFHTSPIAFSNVNITPLNDPPAILSGAVTGYTENSPPIPVDGSLTITDDNSDLTGAKISISANYIEGDDILSFSPIGNITGTWDAPSATLILNGIDTISNYISALRSVAFSSTSDNPGEMGGLSRTISFEVNDGVSISPVATSTINIAPVNDAPSADPVPHEEIITKGTTEYTQGIPLADRIAGDTDVDGDPIGIAVIGVEDTNGSWQYSVDDGDTWFNFGTVSETGATLLAPTTGTRIRFVPDDTAFTGSVGIDFRVWDQTAGTHGQTGVDVTLNGGITPFSAGIESAVFHIADAPFVPTQDGPVDNNTILPTADTTISSSSPTPQPAGEISDRTGLIGDLFSEPVQTGEDVLELAPLIPKEFIENPIDPENLEPIEDNTEFNEEETDLLAEATPEQIPVEGENTPESEQEPPDEQPPENPGQVVPAPGDELSLPETKPAATAPEVGTALKKLTNAMTPSFSEQLALEAGKTDGKTIEMIKLFEDVYELLQCK